MTTTTKDKQTSSAEFVESALYLLGLDPKTLDTADLVTAIEGCGQLRGMVSAAEAGFITEYEARCGTHETTETLKKKQKLSARRAKRRAKTAKNTAGNNKVAEALKAGEISDEHADVLADAEQEHEGATDELLETAKDEGVDRFGQSTRGWARGRDGDSEATKQFKARKATTFIRDEDGMGITIAELDPSNHAAFTSALAYWVPKLFNQEQTPTLTADPVLDAALVARTSRQRLADALVAMAAASINPNNVSGPVTARMLLIADYDPLTQALTGRLADGTALTPETVRRLGCEASILPAVFDGDGQPINLGRDARNVSPAQRALLAERDGGCRGCGMAPQWCHAHHIIHWANLGPTDLDNLVLLCPSCHHLVHEGGHSWKSPGLTDIESEATLVVLERKSYATSAST